MKKVLSSLLQMFKFWGINTDKMSSRTSYRLHKDSKLKSDNDYAKSIVKDVKAEKQIRKNRKRK
jgi:hypothetical protein